MVEEIYHSNANGEFMFAGSSQTEISNNIDTNVQLQLQFFLIIVHWSVILFQPECKFPKFAVGVMVPQNLFMLALFGDFYRKTYMNPKKKVANAPTAVNDNNNNIEEKSEGLNTQKRTNAKKENDDGHSDATSKIDKHSLSQPTINGSHVIEQHYT